MSNKIFSTMGLTWLFLSTSLPTADPAGAQAVKVKMGSSLSPPALHVLAPYVALERGLFKKQGLDVEIVEIAGDPNHTKALLSGDLDAAVIIGGTAVMVSASKGAKIRAWLVLPFSHCRTERERHHTPGFGREKHRCLGHWRLFVPRPPHRIGAERCGPR